MSRVPSHCVVALLLYGSMSARADGQPRTDFSGVLRLNGFSSSRALDDRRNLFGSAVELVARHPLASSLTVVSEVRLGAFEIGRTTRTRGELREGYLALRLGPTDWRLGRQRISWGRADGINPTDFFTAQDYQLMLPLESDRRLGADALRVDYNFRTTYAFSVVLAPRFRAHRLPWPGDAPVRRLEERRPLTAANLQWGARLTQSGPGFDWGVAAFHGFSATPVLAPSGSDESRPAFSEGHPRIYGFGGDMAVNLGRYGLRLELAHVRPEGEARSLGVGPYWFGVFGTDRSFGERLNVNLQLVIRHAGGAPVSASREDPLERAAAVQNAVTFGITRRMNYGMTSRAAARWLHDTLEAELLLYLNFQPGNYMARPMVTYALDDRVKLNAGIEYYGGHGDSLFGQLRRNRTAFLEAKYGF